MDKFDRHSYSKKKRKKILEKTGCKCGHCGKDLDTASMTVEHIFPIAKGGNDDEFNLIALCRACNYNKGNWVYKVSEYYKYILPEYVRSYIAYNENIVSTYKHDRLINFDVLTYSIIPDKYKLIVYNMIKRGAKKKKIKETVDRLTMTVIMDRAFEGDAEEILELINKLKDKTTNIFDTSLYDNVYSVRNDIRYGEAYVLRLNGKICGAFIFKKIKPDDIDLVQLNVIEDNTRLRKKYVMTLACFSDIATDILNQTMNDMFETMLRKDVIPMYFNILTNLYKEKDDVIMMPYTLDKVEGTLEFLHLKAIKSRFAYEISERLYLCGEKDIFSEEELLVIADYMLDDNYEDSKDIDYVLSLLSKSKALSEQFNLGDNEDE